MIVAIMIFTVLNFWILFAIFGVLLDVKKILRQPKTTIESIREDGARIITEVGREVI